MAWDQKRFRKEFVLHLATSPATLVPLLVGGTAAGVGILFGAPLIAFAGVAGMAVGGGVCATRFTLGAKKIAARVVAKLEAEDRAARKDRLDTLDHRLLEDNDPRTEDLLRDLRKLVDPLYGDVNTTLFAGVPTALGLEIKRKIEELFERCVIILDQTLVLWQNAQELKSPKAREPFVAQRERLIEEVTRSIERISATLAELSTMGNKAEDETEVRRIRDDLERTLAVARRVDVRMREIGSLGYDPREFEQEHENGS